MNKYKLTDFDIPSNLSRLSQGDFNDLLYQHKDLIIKLLKEYLEIGYTLYKQGTQNEQN